MNEKLAELTSEELAQVTGGVELLLASTSLTTAPNLPVCESLLQCGIDGNNAGSGGGVYTEEKPEPVDCSGLIP